MLKYTVIMKFYWDIFCSRHFLISVCYYIYLYSPFIVITFKFLHGYSFSSFSNRQHLSSDYYLEERGKDYRQCFVLCCMYTIG